MEKLTKEELKCMQKRTVSMLRWNCYLFVMNVYFIVSNIFTNRNLYLLALNFLAAIVVFTTSVHHLKDIFPKFNLVLFHYSMQTCCVVTILTGCFCSYFLNQENAWFIFASFSILFGFMISEIFLIYFSFRKIEDLFDENVLKEIQEERK